jgi:hypothetical protein
MRFLIATSLLITLAISSFAATPEQQASFFTGVIMLQAKSNLSSEEKAKKYLELVQMTGISSNEAREILKKVRDNPAVWQTLQPAIAKLLNEPLSPAAVSPVKKPFVGPIQKKSPENPLRGGRIPDHH